MTCVRSCIRKHMCTFSILMRCVAHYKSEIWWSVHLWTQAFEFDAASLGRIKMKIQDITGGWTQKIRCVPPAEKANDLNILKVENDHIRERENGKREIVPRKKKTEVIVRSLHLWHGWLYSAHYGIESVEKQRKCILYTHLMYICLSWMSYIIWLFLRY